MNHNKLTLPLALSLLILVLPSSGMAQYKSAVPSIPGIQLGQSSGAPSFFGIDLSKIDFQHSYSMSIGSSRNNTVATGLLQSSFNYVINPQVSVQGFVGLIHSPFSNFTPVEGKYSAMQGISMENMFYGGEITYQPKENLIFQFGISKIPVSPSRQYNKYMYPYTRRGY